MSKLQSDALREAITGIVADSKEKNRKFVETIGLQIGLKNYDPQKDKRFSGSVKLPHIPRPKMKIGKFPTLVTHQESLESKVNETKAMVKFQLKKVLCMGVAVGNVSMEEKQIFHNVQLSVNFLVSLLKKNWQNVRCLYLKSTMRKSYRVF
ncbi:60S ribosomal protein [Arachis hypogaea]|nr:60S ribosomal protein [Arachis hypogaea]